MKYYDYLFEIINEDSDLCGERFFVELPLYDDETELDKLGEAEQILEIELNCDQYDYEYIGFYTEAEADELGYDTF